MEINNDDILEILKLLEESDYNEVLVEWRDFRIHVCKTGSGPILQSGNENEPRQPQSSLSPTPAALNPADTVEETGGTEAPVGSPEGGSSEGLYEVVSPMMGMFYRAPSPGADPYVEEGSAVEPDDTVCLLEIMKTFNSVPAGVSGRVVRICVVDGAPVELGQTMMLIEPRS